MGRALVRWFGVAVSAVMTIVSVTQDNTVGAVFFGAGTLFLIWSVIRPDPDPDSTFRPLRVLAVGAAVVTVIAAVAVLAAVASGPGGRAGLAVVAAVSMVAFAGMLWCVLVIAWRRGWRWSSATTRGQFEEAAASGERVEAPPGHRGRRDS